MPWFKVDDTLAFHGKVVAAGNAAIGMWVRAGAWSAQTLTEGFVPDHMVSALGSAAQARALVAVGLWDRDDGGYRFHDWRIFQPSRESVEAERAAAKERQRRARERAKAARESRDREADASRRDDAVTHGVTAPVVTVPPTRPDPTRPVLLTSLGSLSKSNARDEAPPPGADEPPSLTETTLDAFGTWCDQHDQPRPPKAVRIGLASQISSLIAEDIPIGDISRGLIAWQGKTNLGPSALPSVVHEVRSRPATNNRRQQATDDLFDRAMQRATAKEAQQ